MQQYRDLADYITSRARDLGYNTTNLSERLDFGQSYINSIVNEQFGPSVKRCRQIAEFFGDDPNIILELAGFYVPPQEDDPVIRGIVQTTGTMPPRLRREVLEYASYLKVRAVAERRQRYSTAATLYVELPNGDSAQITMSPESAVLTIAEIEHIIVTALEKAQEE